MQISVSFIEKVVARALIKFGFKPKEGAAAEANEEAAEDVGAITAELQAAIEAAVSSAVQPIQTGIQAQLSKAQADLTAAGSQIKDLQSQVSAKEEEISKLKAEAKTAGELAAEEARKLVAAQGVKVTELPEGSQTGDTTEQKIETLQKQLAATNDPVESYTIAKQINELRWGKKEDKK